MPLTGPESDKLGNRYEALWTTRCLLKMLASGAGSIYIEPFGDMGRGIEFRTIDCNGKVEVHQVKRQHRGGFTLIKLKNEDVLSNFGIQLRANPETVCAFVSQDQPSDLRELIDNARYVESFEAFRENYLSQGNRSSHFDALGKGLEATAPEETFDLLKRLKVLGSEESMLREEAELRARHLVDEIPDKVVRLLGDFVVESIHKTLTPESVWEFLEGPSCGFKRVVTIDDPDLRKKLDATVARYLQRVRSQDILGEPIKRLEAEKGFDLIEEIEFGGLLIEGEAGVGKTGVVREVIEKCLERKWPTIAFRLDSVDPAHRTTKQLGEELGLPDSPVTVLGELARGGSCLLVIDQLDAVSTTSGRSTTFFDLVDQMLAETRIYPGMRVVLACRKFDLENDDRLMKLVLPTRRFASRIHVPRLQKDKVKEIVSNSGGSASELTDAQVEILSNPLHLNLFTSLNCPSPFSSLKDLFDRYWEKKRLALKELLKRQPNWNEILDRVLKYMTEHQSLSIPQAYIIDSDPEEVNAMLSEGVLVQDGERILFFHELFFDYSFARRFVAEGKELISFTTGQEQHLFLRGIVRQILSHLRAADRQKYLQVLAQFLTNDQIRFHLKRLVIDWLRTLTDPSIDEWRIVNGLASNPDEDLARWSLTVKNSSFWFDLLDSIGWLQKQLASDSVDEATQVANYIILQTRERPIRVAELARCWPSMPEPWPALARSLIGFAEADSTHLYIDMYLDLRNRGLYPLPEPPFNSSSGLLFYGLDEKEPEWAIEVFAEWFRSLVSERSQKGQSNPFFTGDDSRGRNSFNLQDHLEKMAEAAPARFVSDLLPITLEIINANLLREGDSPWDDSVWSIHSFSDRYSLDDQLIFAMATALRGLAKTEPGEFADVANQLHSNLDSVTAGRLLLQGYSGNGEAFAETAVELLIDRPIWLERARREVRELLIAISPHVSETNILKLEAVLLNHYEFWERLRSPSSLKYPITKLGYSQLQLLRKLDTDRISETTRRRILELERKFGPEIPEEPHGVMASMVGPPFVANWDRMTDDDWLKAIARYQDERSYSDDIHRGGARQLASILSEQTKESPTRFVNLLPRIPVESNPEYREAILRGLRDSQCATATEVWDAVRQCYSQAGHAYGRAIGWVVAAYVDCDIPNDVLGMISRYAIEDPDPTTDNWEPDDSNRGHYRRNAAHAGLNSVRGYMARVIADILNYHRDRLEVLEPPIAKLVADPIVAVRTQTIAILRVMLRWDEDQAVELFLQLCEPLSEAFLLDDEFANFVLWCTPRHFAKLRPFVEAMLASNDQAAQRHGAMIAYYASLKVEGAGEMATGCIAGTEAMRLGIAEIGGDLVRHPEFRERTSEVLSIFFNDSSSEVRSRAARCFFKFEEESFLACEGLIRNFINSEAFAGESYGFFHSLEKLAVPLPEIILEAFDQSAKLMRQVSTEEAFRTGKFSDRNGQIVVRLYDRTADLEIKSRCLDVIDQLARSAISFSSNLTTRDS